MAAKRLTPQLIKELRQVEGPEDQDAETRSLRRSWLKKQQQNLWRWLSIPILAFILLPLGTLLLRIPPGEWLANLNLLQVREAFFLSLSTTLVTLAVTIIFGTPVAYWLARNKSIPGRILDSVIDLPTVLPPAVAGVALLLAFGRRGLMGGVFDAGGIQVVFTPLAVIMAQTFVASPYYIRAAMVGFTGIEEELKQAAALDGANNWEIFRFIAAPLAASSVFSGAVMSWARALGEFGATIIFAGNFPGRTQTMPLAIYMGFQLDLNVALTLSVTLLLISFIVLMVVKGLLHGEWR
ncbi:MAG: ABC transporter permease [Chloroflexi bacterium]|nr:ABC transporter permease [Chloroflexota bacterium]